MPDVSTVTLTCKITDSANKTYTWAYETLTHEWNEYQICLCEPAETDIDLTEIDKVEVIYRNDGTNIADVVIHIDNMLATYGITGHLQTTFFIGGDMAYQQIFTVPLVYEAGESLIARVANLSAQPGAYEMGINGREVTV